MPASRAPPIAPRSPATPPEPPPPAAAPPRIGPGHALPPAHRPGPVAAEMLHETACDVAPDRLSRLHLTAPHTAACAPCTSRRPRLLPPAETNRAPPPSTTPSAPPAPPCLAALAAPTPTPSAGATPAPRIAFSPALDHDLGVNTLLVPPRRRTAPLPGGYSLWLSSARPRAAGGHGPPGRLRPLARRRDPLAAVLPRIRHRKPRPWPVSRPNSPATPASPPPPAPAPRSYSTPSTPRREPPCAHPSPTAADRCGLPIATAGTELTSPVRSPAPPGSLSQRHRPVHAPPYRTSPPTGGTSPRHYAPHPGPAGLATATRCPASRPYPCAPSPRPASMSLLAKAAAGSGLHGPGPTFLAAIAAALTAPQLHPPAAAARPRAQAARVSDIPADARALPTRGTRLPGPVLDVLAAIGKAETDHGRHPTMIFARARSDRCSSCPPRSRPTPIPYRPAERSRPPPGTRSTPSTPRPGCSAPTAHAQQEPAPGDLALQPRRLVRDQDPEDRRRLRGAAAPATGAAAEGGRLRPRPTRSPLRWGGDGLSGATLRLLGPDQGRLHQGRIPLPRVAQAQYRATTKVPAGEPAAARRPRLLRKPRQPPPRRPLHRQQRDDQRPQQPLRRPPGPTATTGTTPPRTTARPREQAPGPAAHALYEPDPRAGRRRRSGRPRLSPRSTSPRSPPAPVFPGPSPPCWTRWSPSP